MIDKVIKRIEREVQCKKNQRCVYDYPEESGGWKKYIQNPVLSDKKNSMFDPFVRIIDDRFVMCVSNRGNNTLEFYRSQNGTHWGDPIEILRGRAESKWERKVNRGCFLIHNGLWYLWYTGQHEGKSKIGLAISEDGVNFHRNESNPVLAPEFQFEGMAVMNPCTIWDESRQVFCMWYAAGDNYEPDVLCYAESIDGMKWEKRTKPVLTADKTKKYQKAKVGACDILHLANGLYCMAYITYENVNVARIALAYSENGICNWVLDKENPILAPTRKSWDRHSVYKPTLCFNPKTQEIMLWYNGRNNHTESIGLAVLGNCERLLNKNKE